jgi:hypothetical protein
MNTEALIQELAQKCVPVKPMAPPLARLARWGAAATICLTAGVMVLGPRDDLTWSAGFVVQTLLLLGLAVVSALAALQGGVPGEKRHVLIPVVVLVAWALLLVATLSGSGPAGVGWRCIRNVLFLGAPPGMVLYLMLHRAAPLDAGGVGWLAALSAAALANVGTRFVCHHDGAVHTLAWHCLPLVLLSGAGILLGRLALRR